MIRDHRLMLIRERSQELMQAKDIGLQLDVRYAPDDIIFCKKRGRFGKVLVDEKVYLAVDFDGEEVTFYREDVRAELGDGVRTSVGVGGSFGSGASHRRSDARYRRRSRRKSSGDSRRFRWDAEKDQFLLANIRQANAWLAEQLGTTPASIKGRLHRLKARGARIGNRRQCFNWTEEHDKFLIANLGRSNKWLAEHFGTTVGAVKGRLRRLRDRGMISRERPPTTN